MAQAPRFLSLSRNTTRRHCLQQITTTVHVASRNAITCCALSVSHSCSLCTANATRLPGTLLPSLHLANHTCQTNKDTCTIVPS
ncbi:unnamed protein product [Periconia digitata]|uniref:Uncharacterized protein n=1 Tax=Periconia digitata TaxID=1303443 RepID=A0A9W4U825_9PLEO|nr:unnamed protein product [Periconia digitata]